MRLSQLISSLVAAFIFSLSTSLDVAAQGAVAVTPDSETAIAAVKGSRNQVKFTVTNMATDKEHADYFELGCIALGPISSCSLSSESAMLDAREQTSVTVTFTADSTGRGAVAVIAWGKNWHGYHPAHVKVTVTGDASSE